MRSICTKQKMRKIQKKNVSIEGSKHFLNKKENTKRLKYQFFRNFFRNYILSINGHYFTINSFSKHLIITTF